MKFSFNRQNKVAGYLVPILLSFQIASMRSLQKIKLTIPVLLLILGFTPPQQVQQHKLEKPVPVLCYHNIKPSLTGHLPALTISTEEFSRHIKMLHDSGYHSISPEQLYNYLTLGAPLPSHPVLISFDDGKEEQYSLAWPILNQYGFKAVFFIMTVTIGKTNFLTAAQIKQLSDSGNSIGLHTWDHPDMRHISPDAWPLQIDKPKSVLQNITGKPVEFFAWPYGAWNEEAASQLSNHGLRAAFQLSGKSSPTHPSYTIRRLQVSGSWSSATLLNNLRSAFR